MSASPSPAGVPPRPVVLFLRVEGVAALAAALLLFHVSGGNWWVFLVLFLAPDLSMFAWLLGARAGAMAYNLAHTYTAPALLAGLGFGSGYPLFIELALIWLAHIGADRALGYGLKYGSFEETHLGPIGRGKRTLGERAAD